MNHFSNWFSRKDIEMLSEAMADLGEVMSLHPVSWEENDRLIRLQAMLTNWQETKNLEGVVITRVFA